MTRFVRRHGRTLLGGLLGAVAGATYAWLVGCRTGACVLTSNPWTAAAFFGLTGAIALAPGRPRRGEEGSAGPTRALRS